MVRLGLGGIERWVANPVVLWMVAYGGHLTARSERDPPPTDHADPAQPREASL